MGTGEKMKKLLNARLEEKREAIRELCQMIAKANLDDIHEMYELSDELNSCCDEYLELEYDFNRLKKRYGEKVM